MHFVCKIEAESENKLIVASTQKQLSFFHINSAKMQLVAEYASPITAISPGKHLIVGTEDGRVELFDKGISATTLKVPSFVYSIA